LSKTELRTNEQEGKVIISGEVPDHKRDLFDQIVEQFGDDTINLVIDEKIEDLNSTFSCDEPVSEKVVVLIGTSPPTRKEASSPLITTSFGFERMRALPSVIRAFTAAMSWPVLQRQKAFGSGF